MIGLNVPKRLDKTRIETDEKNNNWRLNNRVERAESVAAGYNNQLQSRAHDSSREKPTCHNFFHFGSDWLPTFEGREGGVSFWIPLTRHDRKQNCSTQFFR